MSEENGKLFLQNKYMSERERERERERELLNTNLLFKLKI